MPENEDILEPGTVLDHAIDRSDAYIHAYLSTPKAAKRCRVLCHCSGFRPKEARASAAWSRFGSGSQRTSKGLAEQKQSQKPKYSEPKQCQTISSSVNSTHREEEAEEDPLRRHRHRRPRHRRRRRHRQQGGEGVRHRHPAWSSAAWFRGRGGRGRGAGRSWCLETRRDMTREKSSHVMSSNQRVEGGQVVIHRNTQATFHPGFGFGSLLPVRPTPAALGEQ